MGKRLRFREAWRALDRLYADPEDTRAVFEILQALEGNCTRRAYRRFRRSETGQRILRDRRSLLATLSDRALLMAMPEGSLGRHYAEFTAREQLSADGLVEASAGTYEDVGSEDAVRFGERLRDMHDLEHVAVGYGRDLRGEGALLAFDLSQHWYHGLALIVGMSWWHGDAEERRVLRDAWRRGRRAHWLPASDWEALLPLPLAQVRERLGLGDPPRYEPLRSDAAPALG